MTFDEYSRIPDCSCGGKVSVNKSVTRKYMFLNVAIECQKCGSKVIMRGSISENKVLEQKVIKAWNERVTLENKTEGVSV